MVWVVWSVWNDWNSHLDSVDPESPQSEPVGVPHRWVGGRYVHWKHADRVIPQTPQSPRGWIRAMVWRTSIALFVVDRPGRDQGINSDLNRIPIHPMKCRR